MTLPAHPFYNPLARALMEQRQILALDANKRQLVANALDALALAPEKIEQFRRLSRPSRGLPSLVNARTDDDLRGVLDYLWSMARAVEDGDMSDAEQRLQAARDALEQALKDGASQQEISSASWTSSARPCRTSCRATWPRWRSAACRTCRRCRTDQNTQTLSRKRSAKPARPHREPCPARRSRTRRSSC